MRCCSSVVSRAESLVHHSNWWALEQGKQAVGSGLVNTAVREQRALLSGCSRLARRWIGRRPSLKAEQERATGWHLRPLLRPSHPLLSYSSCSCKQIQRAARSVVNVVLRVMPRSRQVRPSEVARGEREIRPEEGRSERGAHSEASEQQRLTEYEEKRTHMTPCAAG